MNANPVYKREVLRSIRAPRMLLSIFFFNLLLGMVGIAITSILIMNTKSLQTMNYTTVVRAYELLAVVDGFLVLIMTPTLCAGGICHERERNTFDTLIVSGISEVSIVYGKLKASMAIVMTLITSTLPILSLAFVFGGIRYLGLMLLMLILFTHAAYLGSISLAFSAYSRSITFSLTCSYGVDMCVTFGTAVVGYLLNALGISSIFKYIMLFNPVYTFALFLFNQVGEVELCNMSFRMFGIDAGGISAGRWVCISLIVQIAVSVILVLFAARGIAPYPKNMKYLRDRKNKKSLENDV